jgi:hypothetical protein
VQKNPTGHREHSVDPKNLAYVPLEHVRHLVNPLPEEKVPNPQLLQVAFDTAPVPVENVPGKHCKQVEIATPPDEVE